MTYLYLLYRDFEKDKQLHIILYNKKHYRLLYRLSFKKKKNKSIFYEKMMKVLES